TRAHTNFGWFFGQRAVWENIDPNVTTTFDVTRHGNTCRFNLTVRYICAGSRLQTPFTEGNFGAALSHTFAVRTVLFTVFYATWDKHLPLPPRAPARAPCAAPPRRRRDPPRPPRPPRPDG